MEAILMFVTDGSLLKWITALLTVVGSFRVITTMTPNTTDDKIANGVLKVLNFGSLALGKNRLDLIDKK